MTLGCNRLERQQGGGGLALTLKDSWGKVTPGGDPVDTCPETGLSKAVWGQCKGQPGRSATHQASIYKTPHGSHYNPR